MPKKGTISEEDRALFRETMRGVKPLKKRNNTAISSSPSIKKELQTHLPSPSSIQNPFADTHDYPVAAEEALFFAKSGVQPSILRELRRGQFKQCPTLDLHGKTVVEARDAVFSFLETKHNQGCRFVRIIHGKGKSSKEGVAILKNQVNTWLRQYTSVLAFCSAAAAHGGTGAINVLLKSQNGSK